MFLVYNMLFRRVQYHKRVQCHICRPDGKGRVWPRSTAARVNRLSASVNTRCGWPGGNRGATVFGEFHDVISYVRCKWQISVVGIHHRRCFYRMIMAKMIIEYSIDSIKQSLDVSVQFREKFYFPRLKGFDMPKEISFSSVFQKRCILVCVRHSYSFCRFRFVGPLFCRGWSAD